MPREIIQPDGVWDPRPRFAQVVRVGKQVCIAGQTSVDMDGNLVGRGEIETQALQVFRNLRKCLEAVARDFDHVVKLNICSTDLDAHREVIARLRRQHFREPVANRPRPGLPAGSP